MCHYSPLFPVKPGNEASSLMPPSEKQSSKQSRAYSQKVVRTNATAKFGHYHGDKSMKLVCRAILLLRSQWLAVALVNVASSA